MEPNYPAIVRPQQWSISPRTETCTRPSVRIGDRRVGSGYAVYVIGEIGINHNGELEIAKRLIDLAAAAGVDAVKFQKRTPEVCVPREQWMIERDTPWGRMTYIDYRARMEFDEHGYGEIDRHCRNAGIDWFLSCWDEPSVDFAERFDPPCYKVASASLTDSPLLQAMRATGRPIILSTGMSTQEEIDAAVVDLGTDDLLLAHANSTYPCPAEILNLRMIHTLEARFPTCPIGYSGHEEGVAASIAAVALGATFVERHITLDKSMWGSDQKASLDPRELHQLVAGIRVAEQSLGDGVKRRYESELPAMRKLRRTLSEAAEG